uniref:Uncharacterized protein n=1 Tax=Pseudictyota dubia TaxID=2749911 RepID=A0A7R9ZHD5_9STRA
MGARDTFYLLHGNYFISNQGPPRNPRVNALPIKRGIEVCAMVRVKLCSPASVKFRAWAELFTCNARQEGIDGSHLVFHRGDPRRTKGARIRFIPKVQQLGNECMAYIHRKYGFVSRQATTRGGKDGVVKVLMGRVEEYIFMCDDDAHFPNRLLTVCMLDNSY